MTEERQAELNEAVDHITDLCIRSKCPLFLVYAEETKDGTVYRNSVITPMKIGVKLSDDKITKYSASLNKNLRLTYRGVGLEKMETGDIVDTFIGEEE